MNISNKIKEEGFIRIDYAENQYEIFHNNMKIFIVMVVMIKQLFYHV